MAGKISRRKLAEYAVSAHANGQLAAALREMLLVLVIPPTPEESFGQLPHADASAGADLL